MTLEEIVERAALAEGFQVGVPFQVYARRACRRAVREALELAAEIADSQRDKTFWDDPSAGIAATIRSLAATLEDKDAT